MLALVGGRGGAAVHLAVPVARRRQPATTGAVDLGRAVLQGRAARQEHHRVVARASGRQPPSARVRVSTVSVAAAQWKLDNGTSPSAFRTRSRGTDTWRPPRVTWLATLPPRPAVRAAWCLPFGPQTASRSSSIIACSTCKPGRDAQAVTRMRDVPQHAEHRQRHPDRHRTRGWGLAAGLPPVIGHGWQFPALIPPLSDHGQGQEVATPLHISSTSTPAGTFPGHSPGSRPGRRPGSGTHHSPRRGRVWRSTPAVPPARAADARPRRRNWPRRRARSAAVS